MKTKLKSILAIALCAVGLAAFAEEPDAVQLWKDGPYFATVNLGDAEQGVPAEYGALYTFDNATNEVAKLGAGWRVPSEEELKMLAGKNDGDKVCSNVWTTCNGVAGRRFFGMTSGYEDKSVFLPAAGYNRGGSRLSAGVEGYFWSSVEKDGDNAWYLYFKEGNASVYSNVRSRGMSVRAVRDTPPTPTPPEPSDEEVVATAEATFVLGPALAVANVTTATHWPWDGKIDVTCDLTGTGKVQLSAALTTNGVTVCTATAENVTGETEIDLDQVGGVTNGVKFVWNAKADCPAGFNSTDTKVKVTAKKVEPQPLPVGALKGVFSVSADKKVHFSQGNLWYGKVGDAQTATFQFEANQYEFHGYDSANNTWGLFGWVGASSTFTSSPEIYGVSTSTTYTDYGNSATDALKADWGTAIDDKGTWSTLSRTEWFYLFAYDPEKSDFDKTSPRYPLFKYGVTVCGKANCVVLLPDKWDTSLISLDTFASTTEYNEETSVKWSAMEAAGAVCLPAAGRRFGGSSASSVGDKGYYWSSAASNVRRAYSVYFLSGNVYLNEDGDRNYGYSVRLVTEVK